jgi:Replication regulatory protein RepB
MLKLEPVSRLSEGVEQIKVFLKGDEREQLRQVCQEKGISMTHLARQLLVAWASQQENESA